jgi:hypothetical protein
MSTPSPMAPMMDMARQAMQNPAAQTVPQPSGAIDPTQHPVIAAILKAVSDAAGAYGWTSMPPQQRLESQNLAQQKAEAMARLGMQQQQLGLEGQRVGIEQQRATTEATGVKQTGEYQRGELEQSGKRTAIEQQRANQEHQDRIAEHDLRSKQLEEDIRYHRAETTTAQGRLAVERQANALAGERIDMEKKHFEDQIALQGKQYTRQLAEDERKQLHTSLDEYYKEHPWIANLSGTGAGTLQQKHKDIDAYIDQKIGVSSGYSGWKPEQGVLAQPNAPATAADWLAQKGVKPTGP